MVRSQERIDPHTGCPMIEILVSVCMVNDPAQCKDVHLNFMAESVTPMECMVIGQAEIAKWIEGQPKWQLKRWSCGPAGQIAKI